MDYHPILDTIAIALLASVTIGFTSPSSSSRLVSLFILAYFTFHCLSVCHEHITKGIWASTLGGYTIFSFLHYLDVALLSGWSFEAHGPINDLINRNRRLGNSKSYSKSRGSRQLQILSRLKFGLSTFLLWRFVNTSYQSRTALRLDKTSLYSRCRFLFHTGLTIIICYLTLYAACSFRAGVFTKKFYSLDKVKLISTVGEISLKELVTRYLAAVQLGLGLLSFQHGVYAITAFINVATGLGSPLGWPPFNGPILTSFGVRHFWSMFWLRTDSHSLNALVNYLMHSIFGLQRSGRLVRYIRIFLKFAISGIIYAAIDFSLGMLLQISVRYSEGRD
ncbi:uncharacterized protein F4812DRAFT_215355 [Daldinia caldariorum]|uniref:uncharacterized protein n=1 Tax=Daldinia caldariorum TaxID=326644 RepID=UPI002007809D|nr:uncharacterized protein F4812DRAFT_215355 [Daldinia caldariorum]KAI1464201.1 hypothetical protein F4812DRAFT_215355 [Daldinia caldariorum]